MWLFVSFILILEGVLCFSTSLCPPMEDIQPCYCVSDGKNIRVDCMQVSSVEELRRGLQSLKGIRHVFIDFLRSRVDKIPSDLFQGLHITKLSFTNCNLEQIGDDGRLALEGLEDSIEEFSIHFSFVSPNELKFLNVSRLNRIEELGIEGNDMIELSDDWFRNGPTSLETLYIMNNLIQKIGDNAFAFLYNLRNLWLTGNHFKTLKRSMFPNPAPFLTSLDLTDNEISSIPEYIFINMPSLKEVILAENYIQTLPENSWSRVWSQLRSVYLESNPLECDNIDWMFKLSRPYVLKGQCVTPEGRKGLEIKKIIDDKKWEDEFGDYN